MSLESGSGAGSVSLTNRNRIRSREDQRNMDPNRNRIRSREDQRNMDPTDLDPQLCYLLLRMHEFCRYLLTL